MYLEDGFENPHLQTGKENLQSFLENSPVGIHIVNDEGIIVFANKAELDLFGYEKHEYIGQPFKKFYHNDELIEKLSLKLRNEGSLINQPAKIIRKDGVLKDVLISCNVYYQEGKFKHTRCFTRDITEIKKSENYLKFLNQASEELAATHDTNEALDKIIKLLIPAFTDWIVINELGEDGFAHLLKMGHVDSEKVKWVEAYRKTHPINVNDPRKVQWAML